MDEYGSGPQPELFPVFGSEPDENGKSYLQSNCKDTFYKAGDKQERR